MVYSMTKKGRGLRRCARWYFMYALVRCFFFGGGRSLQTPIFKSHHERVDHQRAPLMVTDKEGLGWGGGGLNNTRITRKHQNGEKTFGAEGEAAGRSSGTLSQYAARPSEGGALAKGLDRHEPQKEMEGNAGSTWHRRQYALRAHLGRAAALPGCQAHLTKT